MRTALCFRAIPARVLWCELAFLLEMFWDGLISVSMLQLRLVYIMLANAPDCVDRMDTLLRHLPISHFSGLLAQPILNALLVLILPWLCTYPYSRGKPPYVCAHYLYLLTSE